MDWQVHRRINCSDTSSLRATANAQNGRSFSLVPISDKMKKPIDISGFRRPTSMQAPVLESLSSDSHLELNTFGLRLVPIALTKKTLCPDGSVVHEHLQLKGACGPSQMTGRPTPPFLGVLSRILPPKRVSAGLNLRPSRLIWSNITVWMQR